jgi:hypothetical protein
MGLEIAALVFFFAIFVGIIFLAAAILFIYLRKRRKK